MKQLLMSVVVVLSFVTTMNAQQNIAKLGIGGLLSRTINLEYERTLTEKTSIFAEVGVQFPYSIPQAGIDAIEDPGTANSLSVTEGKYNNFYVAAEYRIYPKGEGPKGFFYAPYLKFSNYSIDLTGTYDNVDNGLLNVPSSIDGNMNAFSLGLQLGYQWVIKERVTINWSFFGAGVGFNSLKAEFTSDDQNVYQVWKTDVETFLADFPGTFEIEADDAARTITGSTSLIFPAARISLSVGYIF